MCSLSTQSFVGSDPHHKCKSSPLCPGRKVPVETPLPYHWALHQPPSQSQAVRQPQRNHQMGAMMPMHHLSPGRMSGTHWRNALILFACIKQQPGSRHSTSPRITVQMFRGAKSISEGFLFSHGDRPLLENHFWGRSCCSSAHFQALQYTLYLIFAASFVLPMESSNFRSISSFWALEKRSLQLPTMPVYNKKQQGLKVANHERE